MLRDALDLLEPDTRRRGVEVTVTGRSQPVLADPVALEQIVHNLLNNALQALDDVPDGERRLGLEVAQEGGLGVLIVRDSGPGIAPEVLARVFEPFFSTRQGGLGLGLSLCETLAQAMGGTLAAAQRRAARRGVPARAAAGAHRSQSVNPVSPLIHLIDDDDAVRDSLALLIGTVGLRVQRLERPAGVPRDFDRAGDRRDRARRAHAGHRAA